MSAGQCELMRRSCRISFVHDKEQHKEVKVSYMHMTHIADLAGTESSCSTWPNLLYRLHKRDLARFTWTILRINS